MIQKAIKILTLGFFISMITGFVIYRMGYFETDQTGSSLQTSPNGGEFLLANVDQDTNRPPAINQNNQEPIAPSSKSIVPVFDLEQFEQDQKKKILPSSKSMLHPIQIKPSDSGAKRGDEIMSSSKSFTFPIDLRVDKNAITEQNRKAIQKQAELVPKDSDSLEKARKKADKSKESGRLSDQMVSPDESAIEVDKPKGIHWGLIGLGVLGILFVGIGSIVYFKRKSK